MVGNITESQAVDADSAVEFCNETNFHQHHMFCVGYRYVLPILFSLSLFPLIRCLTFVGRLERKLKEEKKIKKGKLRKYSILCRVVVSVSATLSYVVGGSFTHFRDSWQVDFAMVFHSLYIIGCLNSIIFSTRSSLFRRKTLNKSSDSVEYTEHTWTMFHAVLTFFFGIPMLLVLPRRGNEAIFLYCFLTALFIGIALFTALVFITANRAPVIIAVLRYQYFTRHSNRKKREEKENTSKEIYFLPFKTTDKVKAAKLRKMKLRFRHYVGEIVGTTISVIASLLTAKFTLHWNKIYCIYTLFSFELISSVYLFELARSDLNKLRYSVIAVEQAPHISSSKCSTVDTNEVSSKGFSSRNAPTSRRPDSSLNY